MATDIQTQRQIQIPDSVLSEVWAVMHFAVTSDFSLGTDNSSKTSSEGGHVMTEYFQAEGEVEDLLEEDLPGDENKIYKDAADKLAGMGDAFVKNKEEEEKLVNSLVKVLSNYAENIDEKFEKQLSDPKRCKELFQNMAVDATYSQVRSKFSEFLVGSEGVTTIAVVTHITKGVSAALRDVAPPLVNLAAFMAVRFISEKCPKLIVDNGGLHGLVK